MIPQIESTYYTWISELVANYRTEELKRQQESLPQVPPALMHYDEYLAHIMIDHYMTRLEEILVKALEIADRANNNEDGTHKVEGDFEVNGVTYFFEATIVNSESDYRSVTNFQPAESDFQSTIAIDKIVTFDEENNEIEVQLC